MQSLRRTKRAPPPLVVAGGSQLAAALLAVLGTWFLQSYQALQQEIKQAREAADKAEAGRLRQQALLDLEVSVRGTEKGSEDRWKSRVGAPIVENAWEKLQASIVQEVRKVGAWGMDG